MSEAGGIQNEGKRPAGPNETKADESVEGTHEVGRPSWIEIHTLNKQKG